MAAYSSGSHSLSMTAIDFTDLSGGTITSASAKEIDVTGASGTVYKIIGTGFTTFDGNGFPTDGTVTGFDIAHGGGSAAAFAGLSMAASTFMGFVDGDDLTGFESAALSGDDHIKGYKGNDLLVGGAGNDLFNLVGGGDDTVQGGDGADKFSFAGTFTAADTVDGGAGNDRVLLNGDYSTGITLGATTLTSVEYIVLSNGHSYDITTNDANVAAGDALAVQAQTLNASSTLTFDGSAETDGSFHVNGGKGADHLIGGAGNDVLSGGDGNDVLDGSRGGHDVILGGAGNDTIMMGTNFNTGGHIDGGTGSDTLVITGATGLTLTGDALTGIETVAFAGSWNYSIATDDSAVAAGKTLTIDASGIAAGYSLNFNGSGETDGAFHIIGSAGNDTLVGGNGDDIFTLAGGVDYTAALTSGAHQVTGGAGDDTIIFNGVFNYDNRIDGGPGNDTLVLNGDYTGEGLQPVGFQHIETVKFEPGHSYKFLLGDIGNPGYSIVTYDGTSLKAGDNLSLDAINFMEQGYNPQNDIGHVVLKGGAGDDWLRGSGVNDNIYGGAGDDVIIGAGGPDTESGGAGRDTFEFVYADSAGYYYDRITDFDASQDKVSLWADPDSVAAPVTTNVSSRVLNTFEEHLTLDLAGLASHQAVIYSVTGGALAGHTFLVVNTSDYQGYSIYDNLVVDITGASHLDHFSIDNFI